MASEEASVIVIGGGPAGLTMAAELSYRGVKTILLEKRPTTSNSPKAFALSSRSMEHYRRIGLQEKIQDASYPPDWPISVKLCSGMHKGKTTFQRKLSPWGKLNTSEDAQLFLYQHGTSLGIPMFCPQYTSEAVIRKHVEETSESVQMLWGWGVTNIAQDDSGVTVKAQNEAGDEKTIRAQYLVGCDGGSSFVRKTLGLHMYGKFVVSRACTIWFSSPKFMDHIITNNDAGFCFVVNTKINCLVVLLNNKGDFAMHVYLPSGYSDEEVQKSVKNPEWCIESALGSSAFPVKVLSSSGYNMHALLTTKYRVGRCFLAGDSAHQWLPAGGLGLNTGVSDCADLAWKLEAAIKGYGGERLLDSYQIERRPLADLTRRYALELGTGLIMTSSFTRYLRIALMRFPPTRYLLGKFLDRQFEWQLDIGIDCVLGFQYSNSNVIMHEYDAEKGKVQLRKTLVEAGKFVPSSLPGCRGPHVPLPGIPSIIDLFGKDFVLLVIKNGAESELQGEVPGVESYDLNKGVESELRELKEELSQKKVPFSIYSIPAYPDVTNLYDRRYFLIRPDGVVAWRCDFQPSQGESEKIVATVLGHVTGTSPRLPLPTSVIKDKSGVSAYLRFTRDLVVGVSLAGALLYFTEMPHHTIAMTGIGAFLFMRAASVAHFFTSPKTESTSRHKAAVITKQEGKTTLKVMGRHVGEFKMDDVLIRVHASTVTESDLFIMKGHQQSSTPKLSPLVLGRECSGEVVAVGDGVSKFLPGDMVYAATPPQRQGCHAQLVAINQDHVAFKPSNLDHNEAAVLPQAAITAWSGMVTHAGLTPSNARGKKVLVVQNSQNGNYKVGQVAVQMLKAWGAHVTITCSESTQPNHSSGADSVVVANKSGDFANKLSGFDVVADTIGGKYEHTSLSALKPFRGSTYISCVSPRDYLVSKLGVFFGGLVFDTLYTFKATFHFIFGGRRIYYCNPSEKLGGAYLEEVRRLVEQGAVRSKVDKASLYPLEEISDAYKYVEATHQSAIISIP